MININDNTVAVETSAELKSVLEANYQNSAPLILFNTSSSKFSINDPKSIIIYNKSYACLSFSNTATLSINCGKVDYWLTSPQLISTGVIENNPLYSWYKSNEENIVIASTVTSSKTTITSNNLTQEEKKSSKFRFIKISNSENTKIYRIW